MGKLIEKTLVLSTGHLTLKDSELLDETAKNRADDTGMFPYPHKTLDHGNGFIIYVPSEFKIKRNSEHYIEKLDKGTPQPAEDWDRLDGFSESFKDLLSLAQEMNCCWINFDTDVEADSDLPYYNW